MALMASSNAVICMLKVLSAEKILSKWGKVSGVKRRRMVQRVLPAKRDAVSQSQLNVSSPRAKQLSRMDSIALLSTPKTILVCDAVEIQMDHMLCRVKKRAASRRHHSNNAERSSILKAWCAVRALVKRREASDVRPSLAQEVIHVRRSVASHSPT